MFDVFYSGTKPNRFAHEQVADNIDHAKELSRTRNFWWINYLTDYTEFDFLYEPVPWESHQRHAWPSQWQKDAGTYLVPKQGYSETNYRTDTILTRLPDLYSWSVPDNFDTSSFDWSWHPDPTEPGYIYQFGTQHQRTGGPQYIIPGAIDLKFCDQVKGSVKSGATPIVEINHMDGNAGQVLGVVATVRYFDNYKDILTRIANTAEHEYIWIVSSICDYSNFDFSWHPELWQNTMLHVFASDGEKFGDTFYMHVPSFRRRIGQFELLDWYDVNFIDAGVPRRPVPVIKHTYDTHVEAIKTIDWPGPVALFTTGEDLPQVPVIPLWREKTKTVVPLSPGSTQTLVPKTAVPYIKEQVYDYPYIDRTQRHLCGDVESDVIFISNGETMADANWANLLELCPRARRSDGVLGREAAYKAAAEMSCTPWFFAVFAKTEVLPTFKFDYQPDRLQQPRHYIFHSRNPLNGLEYGAMNINLYNRQLTIDTRPGIDFTLSSLHTVVPVCASISRFNTDPWVTWRSAFREVLKLKLEVDQGADVEIQHRLQVWCTRADGDNAEYCLAGSNDALEYYQEVAGDYEKLCLSFDWAWLQEFYYKKYSRQIWLEVV
jgi:hypothetical protein